MHLPAPHRCTQISGRAARLSPKFHTVTAAGLCLSPHPGRGVPGGPGGSRPAAPGAPPLRSLQGQPLQPGGGRGALLGGVSCCPPPPFNWDEGDERWGALARLGGPGAAQGPPPPTRHRAERGQPLGGGTRRGGGAPSIAPWGAPGVRPLLCSPPPGGSGGSPAAPPARGGGRHIVY